LISTQRSLVLKINAKSAFADLEANIAQRKLTILKHVSNAE
jgi:hypothetical protein